MYAFTYWHTYYDSAFLSHPFKISDAFYQDLEISSAHLLRWPPLEKLPQLPRLYEHLEHFILDDYNWTGCMCSQAQMENIQMQINRLILHLQCEKRYGLQFWLKNNRRIQASIVHFSIFLKKFVMAIIPEDCKNLLQAHRLEKLPAQMPKLEYLMNQILKIIKPIHHFLFRKDFEQQHQLTKQFFLDFNDLIHTLPRIKRSTLTKVPKLMQYICVINPIEAEQYESDEIVHIRRKNATMFEKPKHAKKYSLQKNHNEANKNFKVINNSIVKIKEKKQSLQKNWFDSPKKHSQFIKNFQVFKFNDKVRKYSIYNKAKKQTVASLQTKEKNSSVDKDRSPSYDRSLTIFNDPMKSKSRTIANDVRMKETSFVADRRSRELTTKSIISRRSRSIKKVESLQGEDIQHERDEKTKKKKGSKLPIKTNRYSGQQHLIDGKTKGWGIIRQYLYKKIAERKLKRLLFIY